MLPLMVPCPHTITTPSLQLETNSNDDLLVLYYCHGWNGFNFQLEENGRCRSGRPRNVFPRANMRSWFRIPLEARISAFIYVCVFLCRLRPCEGLIARPRIPTGTLYDWNSRINHFWMGTGHGQENRDYSRRGYAALTTRHPSIRKSWN
jgi:hypothetical protein